MQYLLGIDVSTTATKALLINDLGDVVAKAACEYSYETPRPLWSEQDPSLWWQGAVKSIRQVLDEAEVHPKDILAIGITGQMHGLVLLDDEGKPLRPAILWNDQRTGEDCIEIRRRIGRERLIKITGNDALTGFTAPKILWVARNEPEIYRKARHILLPKDYVRYRLTGELATDKADGSGTILMDLRQREWSAEVVESLGIPNEWLPRLFEGTEITGRVTSEAAELTGLNSGTPIVAGSGDQAAQAVGVGAVSPGIVALTLGTSGVVFVSADQPVIEPNGRLHAFCHAVPGKWHLMGVMLSAGGSLRWFRDVIAPGREYDDLLLGSTDVPAGADGLFFLPYLTGERTPHPDPWARAAFVGLTVRHSIAHMTRAVLEGVAYGLRDNLELMLTAGLPPMKQIRISGGGAKSALWRQILTDVLHTELVTVNTIEGAAYGSALLAGVAIGNWQTVEQACSQVVKITSRTDVNSENSAKYVRLYPLYQNLYPALKGTFDALQIRSVN